MSTAQVGVHHASITNSGPQSTGLHSSFGPQNATETLSSFLVRRWRRRGTFQRNLIVKLKEMKEENVVNHQAYRIYVILFLEGSAPHCI